MIAYDAPNLASSGRTTHRLNRNGVADHQYRKALRNVNNEVAAKITPLDKLHCRSLFKNTKSLRQPSLHPVQDRFVLKP